MLYQTRFVCFCLVSALAFVSASASGGKERLRIVDSNQKICPPQNNRAYIREYRDLRQELDLDGMTKEQASIFVFQPRDAGTGRGVVAPMDDDFQNLRDRIGIKNLGFRPLEEGGWTFVHAETRRTWCAIRLNAFHDPEKNNRWTSPMADSYGLAISIKTTTVLVPRDDLVADEDPTTQADDSGQQRPSLKWLPLTGKRVRLVGRTPQQHYGGDNAPARNKMRIHGLVGLHAHSTRVDPIFRSEDQVDMELSLMDQCILEWMFSGGPGIENFAEIALQSDSPCEQFVAHDKATNSPPTESGAYRTDKDHVSCIVEKQIPLYGPFFADRLPVHGLPPRKYVATRVNKPKRRTLPPPAPSTDSPYAPPSSANPDEDDGQNPYYEPPQPGWYEHVESLALEREYEYVDEMSVPFGNLEFADSWTTTTAEGDIIGHEELVADKYCIIFWGGLYSIQTLTFTR